MLGYDWSHMRVEPGQVDIPRRDGTVVRLPVDETGQTLLNWYYPGDQWQTCFAGPVPAGAVLQIPQAQRTIRRNEAWWRSRLAHVVELIQPSEFNHYIRLEQRIADIERRLQGRAAATEPKMYRSLQDQLQELRTGEKKISTACVDWLKQEGPFLRAGVEQASAFGMLLAPPWLMRYGNIEPGCAGLPGFQETGDLLAPFARLAQYTDLQSLYSEAVHVERTNARLERQVDASKKELAQEACLAKHAWSVTPLPRWQILSVRRSGRSPRV